VAKTGIGRGWKVELSKEKLIKKGCIFWSVSREISRANLYTIGLGVRFRARKRQGEKKRQLSDEGV